MMSPIDNNMCSIATTDRMYDICVDSVDVFGRSEARGQCHLQPGVSVARMLLGALLTSVLASILIYGLQLRLSCWGRTRHRGQHRNMGARGTKPSPPPTSNADSGVVFKKDHESGVMKSDNVKNKEDEKLTITIITNKEPIIEKVTSEDDKKANSASTSKCTTSKICRYFKNRKKRVVNFPYSEWSGKVHCSITKTVNLWADSKCRSVNIGGYEHKKVFLIIK